jgi:hypothetical protein
MFIICANGQFVVHRISLIKRVDLDLNRWLVPGTDTSDPLYYRDVAAAMEACCHDDEAVVRAHL